MRAGLDMTVWGAPFDEWTRQHSEISCERFHGVVSVAFADREWCERCAIAQANSRNEWSFYAFDIGESTRWRLEQFESTTDSSSMETLEAIQQIVAATISAGTALARI